MSRGVCGPDRDRLLESAADGDRISSVEPRVLLDVRTRGDGRRLEAFRLWERTGMGVDRNLFAVDEADEAGDFR